MQTNAIKQAKETHPFKPFSIALSDGEQKPVTRPEQLLVTGDGKTVLYLNDETGGFSILDVPSITELAFPVRNDDDDE